MAVKIRLKCALLKHSNSFELTFTNCDSLRAFLRTGFLNTSSTLMALMPPKNLEIPVEKGYALVETVFDSLDHLNTTMKENILKSKESYSTF